VFTQVYLTVEEMLANSPVLESVVAKVRQVPTMSAALFCSCPERVNPLRNLQGGGQLVGQEGITTVRVWGLRVVNFYTSM
jgi:hypothetical protein